MESTPKAGYMDIEMLEGKGKNREFELYDSIVNGEMRPFLEKFSSKSHIETLFYESREIVYKFEQQLGLEDLLDLTPAPPPDLKARYFTDLIAMEYIKIKRKALNVLNSVSEESHVSLYANKNIQSLKAIARQAHLLSKSVETKIEISWDRDPDSYILFVLQEYLIRSILIYQELFEPYLKMPPKDRYQLGTSLYEHKPPSIIDKEEIERSEEQSRYDFYKRLCDETNTIKRNQDTDLSQQITILKNSTLTEPWLHSVSKEAIENGFVGVTHLAFIMAADEMYKENNILIRLVANMFEEMDRLHFPYNGHRELANADYRSRIMIWDHLISFWREDSKTYYPNVAYLPLYFLDPEAEIFKKYIIEDKPDEISDDFSIIFKRFFNTIKSACFVKLFELETFISDVIGIPLPSALFPDDSVIDQDKEASEISIVKEQQQKISEEEAEDFVRSLRIYWTSDNSIKIQERGKKAIEVSLDRFGHKQKELFKGVIEDDSSLHRYSVGRPGNPELYEQRREYDRRLNLLKQTSKKLVEMIEREFSRKLPNNYKLYERVRGEETGIYKFKFQIGSDETLINKIQRYSELSEDRLNQELDKLEEMIYQGNYPDEIESYRDEYSNALNVAFDKGYLSNDEVRIRLEKVQSAFDLHKMEFTNMESPRKKDKDRKLKEEFGFFKIEI